MASAYNVVFESDEWKCKVGATSHECSAYAKTHKLTFFESLYRFLTQDHTVELNETNQSLMMTVLMRKTNDIDALCELLGYTTSDMVMAFLDTEKLKIVDFITVLGYDCNQIQKITDTHDKCQSYKIIRAYSNYDVKCFDDNKVEFDVNDIPVPKYVGAIYFNDLQYWQESIIDDASICLLSGILSAYISDTLQNKFNCSSDDIKKIFYYEQYKSALSRLDQLHNLKFYTYMIHFVLLGNNKIKLTYDEVVNITQTSNILEKSSKDIEGMKTLHEYLASPYQIVPDKNEYDLLNGDNWLTEQIIMNTILYLQFPIETMTGIIHYAPLYLHKENNTNNFTSLPQIVQACTNTNVNTVCIPVNMYNSHWITIAVDISKMKVFIIDSLPNKTDNSYVDACVTMLANVSGNKISSYTTRHTKLQNDGHQCGIHALVYCFAIASAPSIEEGLSVITEKIANGLRPTFDDIINNIDVAKPPDANNAAKTLPDTGAIFQGYRKDLEIKLQGLYAPQ